MIETRFNKIVLGFLIVIVQYSSGFCLQSNIIEGEGFKIHYQMFGSGDPLLIINGGPGMSSEGFIPLAQELAKNNQTIIYDQRGTGLSTVETIDSSTISIDLMINDIEALRKHLQIDEWTVMGHSFGGMLSYYYATKHPERVTAMIQSSSGGMDLSLLESLNISAALTEMERDSLAFYNAKISGGDNSYQTLLKRGQFLAPAYLYDKKHVPVVAERLTQGNSQVNGIVWQDLQRIGYDTKDDLRKFTKPVLIIHGAQDIVGSEIPETAHEILPLSRLVILEKCRHYGWLDRKEAYFSVIESFLSPQITFEKGREVL